MQYDNLVMKVLSTANTIGKILLTSGAETYRVEKAISTVCKRFDLKAETFVTMTCVLTSAKKEMERPLLKLIEFIQFLITWIKLIKYIKFFLIYIGMN